MGLGIDYGYYQYTTDGGTVRAVKANTFMAALAGLALSTPATNQPVIERRFCRVAYVQDAAGRTRELIVGTAAALEALDGTDSWDLRDPGTATLTTFNFVGGRKETMERKAHVIASQ